MRLLQKIPTRIEPIRVIEWVIAVCTAAGGLYIFSPLYQTSRALHGPSAFSLALSHPLSIMAWGALLLVGAVLVMWGLHREKPQLKSIGWFAIILARFFQILTTWMVVGFL